ANLVLDDDQADGYSLYTADAYETPQSIIQGVVYDDVNNNCMFDEGERTLSGIVVATNPGPYFAITDKDGSYTLTVTPADYTLHTILPQQDGKTITVTCPSPDQGYRVTITDPGQIVQQVNFGNNVYAPPHLSVSVSSTRRRRCFESTTIVRYANSGFATAPDAKVYLQLPKEVGLLSADKPYTRLADGTYEFVVGDLAGGQTGAISIKDIVTCGDESVRGRTVCTRAWITPSNNAPAKPTPTVSITGRCNSETGMARFVIRNTGTADMETSELYRKYANGELASIEQFRLAAGDSLVFWVPSMGYTWRLEADQPEGNGDNKTASVTIEPCNGTVADSTITSGFVNLMPTDDEEAEVSEECMMITDSYDPNDKLVTPIGRTEEYYTPTNTALKYKIRFQNTGTDVAYRVVVVDTLSEHLDLSTLQVGAASHTSRFEVSGKGKPVLTWTFDNIMLPDSTADEPGSHGYIQFSIKPKADLAEKTAVENFADIFFDFNSPIRTNVTVNRIYDMPPVISEAVRVDKEAVLATPGIADFTPAAGRYGAEVTITGKRFAANAAHNKVYLHGRPATVVSASATELKVLVPTGAETGVLKVVTPDGGATSTEAFQVYQPPVISNFSPVEGIVGQTVTLQGEHLETELITGIKLGGLECEVIGHNGNSVTVQVPAGAVTGNFAISTKGGEAVSATAYTVWYQPAISGLSRETDIVGATINITGENFAADKTRNKVLFGKAQAQVLEATATQLVVKVPEQAESGAVTLETPGGKATSSTAFEVIPGPRFAAMQPAQGSVGTVVEISGEHFGVMGQQDRIEFNGQQALVLEASENRYKVRVPRGAATGKVQITGYGGVALSTGDFVVEELAPAEAIQVYPNPNKGRFAVSLKHADFDVQAIEVFDALGKLIHHASIESPRPESLEISLPTAKAGLYLLQIKTDRGLIIKKLTML
ncbi:MAG: IPT/TIG domain-containing protein, partial [Hymenobacteraceae bacterium]|nr:IPT/TIG domain-containing protein [Hymenobacteraceae bacterium]